MTKRIIALCLSAALLAPMAAAHHSFAMFEETKFVTLEGTIKEVHWANPHVWIDMTAKTADGGTEEWSFECGATASLLRLGWKRDTMKPGDAVTITARPMKNGTKAGSLVTATLPSGQVLSVAVTGHVRPGEKPIEPIFVPPPKEGS